MAIYNRKKITNPFKTLLSNINASQFFPNYAPNVKNWRAKLAGNDGRGIHYHFQANEIEEIEQGLQKLSLEISAYKIVQEPLSNEPSDNL